MEGMQSLNAEALAGMTGCEPLTKIKECEERTRKGTETKHGQSSVPFLLTRVPRGSWP
jgi:hypothetical protein